jgi:hypothetical protein
MSWFVRETESDGLLLAPGAEAGFDGALAAVPLRRDSSIAGYFVLAFARGLPRHVELALRSCVADLAEFLVEPSAEEGKPELPRLVLAS